MIKTDEKVNIPSDFKKRVINTYGEKGLAWLKNLCNTIKCAEKTYNLSTFQALPNISFNYTTTATQKNGQTIVVKFCLPGIEADNERAETGKKR